ncbi:hypothetical protein FNH05_18680 [Amycolatopsis rhizosphaerae]|uniref:Uncharacterized protein n=2 Tax=Amycolatopsis rhizosphaerae TaxID=2053003 RepID=A0A558CFY4_9PSEU|nr:hypothetical protein FNH05_18680 [Amycolatopsis rhizosphaerae]
MIELGRWAPASIYTADDDGSQLKEAVVTVLREFGLEADVEKPAVRGSWFQRLWARGRDSEAVREHLATLERALELEGLGKRQADIDKAKAEPVAALLTVVKEQTNAVVRLGSIILIKTEGNVVVWTISEMEAAVMERTSHIPRDPVTALKFLRDDSQGHGQTSLDHPDRDALHE